MIRFGTHRSPRLFVALSMVVLYATGSWATFFSRGKANPISAVATVTGSGAIGLTIKALPLATQVFSGKHFVIPVQVTSTAAKIDTSSLRVDVVYQLFDNAGNTLTPPRTSTTTFQTDLNNPQVVIGTAFIDRTELVPIQFGGQLKYIFRVFQGSAGVYLGGGTAGTAAYPSEDSVLALNDALKNAYSATVVNSFDAPVNPAGTAAFVPDTYETDGLTGLELEPNAVTNPGTLHIEQLNVARIPSGPGGSRPTVAYNFSLIGTSLQKTGQIVLTYPADLNGQIANNGGNPLDLAPYWWDGVSWRLLARPKIDTTLHTVTGYLAPPTNGSSGKPVVASNIPLSVDGPQGLGTQFEGSFALFPAAGESTAAALRPAERIITPNGDGVNDVANFSGLVDGDVVHIFDVRGRRIRTIRASNSSPTQWDGRDDGGGIVASGVYVYQYTSQGERVSGVIAVAK